jgi:hypothetical protein
LLNLAKPTIVARAQRNAAGEGFCVAPEGTPAAVRASLVGLAVELANRGVNAEDAWQRLDRWCTGEIEQVEANTRTHVSGVERHRHPNR